MRYLEDFVVGDAFPMGSKTVSAEDIRRFALEFDPQGYHLEEALGAQTIYQGLIASGWHICALLHRLCCDSYLLDTTCMGSPGVEQIQWIRPLRPDDAIHAYCTVLETRPSHSKPDRGLLLVQWDAENQQKERICSLRGYHLVARRPRRGSVDPLC